MELLEMMINRRSIRKYTGEAIPEEKLKQVIMAGLASESGRNIKPWQLFVVTDPEKILALMNARAGKVGMFEKAGAVIVVCADPEATDVWVEDCSIVMTNMHLMADHLGLGSCWVQGRLRPSNEDMPTEDFVKKTLELPENLVLEAMLSLGIADEEHRPAPHKIEELPLEKVHFI